MKASGLCRETAGEATGGADTTIISDVHHEHVSKSLLNLMQGLGVWGGTFVFYALLIQYHLEYLCLTSVTQDHNTSEQVCGTAL